MMEIGHGGIFEKYVQCELKGGLLKWQTLQ